MACSPALLESNRRNGGLSKGPVTSIGKSISRRNGLKHGLTGAGIVLPDEDAEEVERRFEVLEAEMKPKSEAARQLVNRVALLTVRLDRSANHEAKAISFRMRRAVAEYDDARMAEVERLYSWIAAEPTTNARRLRNSPEGIDRLVLAMEGLRADLAHRDGVRWDSRRCDHLHHLMGLRRVDVPVSRARALSEAIAGDFRHLGSGDGENPERVERQCWAAGQLVDLIDGEIAALKRLREGLDLEGLELDRAEAAARVMFDHSKEAILARKYEAATERGLYRALREFRQFQAESGEAVAAPQLASEPAEELGSSLPDHSEEDVEEVFVDPIDPKVAVSATDGGDGGPDDAPPASLSRFSPRDRPVPPPSRGP